MTRRKPPAGDEPNEPGSAGTLLEVRETVDKDGNKVVEITSPDGSRAVRTTRNFPDGKVVIETVTADGTSIVDTRWPDGRRTFETIPSGAWQYKGLNARELPAEGDLPAVRSVSFGSVYDAETRKEAEARDDANSERAQSILRALAAQDAEEKLRDQKAKNREIKFSEDEFRKDYEEYMREHPRATFTLWATDCPLASYSYIFDHFKDAPWRQDRRRRRKARKPS